MSNSIEVKDLGTLDYKSAWKLQKELLEKIKNKEIKNTLLVCQHPPVITYGKSSKKNNLLINEKELKEKGIELFEVERGGDITFHEPGQLVAYPILDLNNFKRDVHWYMRQLEEVVIRTLKNFNVNSLRIENKTGVWVEMDILNNSKTYGKIASLGVKLSRWCTMHGIALNVINSLEGFNLMHPCGLENIKMTSIQKLIDLKNREDFNFDLVKNSFVKEFLKLFNNNFA